MSTFDRRKAEAAAPPPPPLVAGERLPRAEFHRRYEAMPPGTRAELIGGIVSMPSPLGFDHGFLNLPVAAWLDRYLAATPGVTGALNASTLLDDLGEPQPDALLLIEPGCGGRARIEGNYIAGAPELVVEIARSSRRVDLGPKKADYERAGVLEYVVVLLDPAEVAWHARRGDRLERVGPGPDGLFRSEAFPGLRLDPAALLKADRARRYAALEAGLASPEHAAFVARLAGGGG